jgi:hypothetical protein
MRRAAAARRSHQTHRGRQKVMPARQMAAPEHRQPCDMDSWELIAMFRHARTLMTFTPNAQLSRALANFMFNARCELERRGDFKAEYLLGS